MKVKTLCLVLFMAGAFTVQGIDAQVSDTSIKKRPTKEQMMERQIRRIEKQLLLDDATSAQFASLYREYLEELAANRPKGSAVTGKSSKKDQLTEEQLDQRMQARFDCQKKQLEIKEKYYKRFRKILNAHQTQKLFACKHPYHGNHQSRKKPCVNKHQAVHHCQKSSCPRIMR